MMPFATEIPAVTHAEFMEIFWFCDTEMPKELKAMKGMSDEEIDEKSPIVRRWAILSKIHQAMFGIPTKGCNFRIESRCGSRRSRSGTRYVR
jgi:hypothetical protein